MRIFFIIFIFLTFLFTDLASDDLSTALNQKVSPNFVNTSLNDMLRLFAKQYNLNIVAGDQISGRVTVQLYDVSLANALNTILKAHGYHYIVESNVLLIKPFEMVINGELKTKVVTLNYLNGFHIKTTLLPLLSPRGKIEALLAESEKDETMQRSNILVITDFSENIFRIEEVIKTMDKPGRQLEIEVRLVETSIGEDEQYGLNLPKSIGVSVTNAESNLSSTGGESGSDQNELAAFLPLEGSSGLSWGILAVDKMQLTLDLLAKDKNARLISNPRLTTMDNKKAVIKIGTNIPIPEISRGISGDLYSYSEKEVNINLEVIPRINEGKKITLNVHPVLEEIIDYIGPADYPQPVTSKREVKTTVMVNSGETVVIGGLIKEMETKSVEKVWLLGDIPLLGYLFRHTVIKKEKKDLTIFITTRIMD